MWNKNFSNIILVSLILYITTSCAADTRFGRQVTRINQDSTSRFYEGQKLYGTSSYYAEKFHGRKTANGEIYDMYGLTAAHKELPFGTIILVRNLDNNKTVRVRINDRGPFKSDRILDVSLKAAHEIDLVEHGTAEVEIQILKLGKS